MRPAFFFDRDHTLIAGAPPGLASPAAHAPEHVVLLDGAADALKLARAAGYLVVVVTNQPGPAKGEYTHEAVVQTNARFVRLCEAAGATIDALYACEHHPVGGPGGDPALIQSCDCRKPRPGMLHMAVRDFDIDLTRSAMFGDDDRDMQAAAAAGVRAWRVGPKGVPVLDAVRDALKTLGDVVRPAAGVRR